MEKRVIIAFVLSFAVIYAFQRAFYKPTSPAEQQQQSAQTQPVTPQTPPSAPSAPATEKQPSEKTEAAPAPPPENLQADKVEDFTMDTPLYSATISNVGGVLKSYKLKNFTDAVGHPLETINQTVGNRVGWPLAFSTGDKTIDEQLAKATFVGHRNGDSLRLEYSANGLYARKELVFDPDNYLFDLQTVLTKDGTNIPHSVVWQGGFADQSIPPQEARKNALYQTDSGGYTRVSLATLKDTTEATYKCGFLGLSTCPTSVTTARAGVEDQYFAAVLQSVQGPTQVTLRKQQTTGADGKPLSGVALTVKMPERGKLRVYAGPKQEYWLTKADPQLAGVLDYGMWGFIARPLLAILLWIHKYIGNFGWSIILLTIAMNLVLFPLRLKQQVSMLKMQKIQPQMRRLQDQYKKLKPNDPRRVQVQTDMMNLYKEHGVNPMGGCLPLVLQMPLLFAFYAALQYSVELRHAPWMLWIKDLSQPDPYYVIPIVMAVAMFLQQKMTPTANVDPAQAKMMMIMPLVFTFMFLSYGAGLALYWLTGSIIGVGQQVFINKYWSPQAEAKLRAKSPPEEKRGT